MSDNSAQIRALYLAVAKYRDYAIARKLLIIKDDAKMVRIIPRK